MAAVFCASASVACFSTGAHAQAVANICTGLQVTLPVLQPVAGITSGLLGGLLDPVLNGLVGNVNTNLVGALSGKNIGVKALDQNGNALTVPGSCNVAADSVTVNANKGISMGGGRIDGLGGPNNQAAVAGEINSIALGNGAVTSSTAANAIALGLRGSSTAIDGIAIGRDSSVTATGGMAFGAGSVASRAGMGGGSELFSGTSIASTAGALSIGAVGNERQIINVAGGTANTDAVNVRQLRAVGANIATSFGGGAQFNSVTGAYTGPTFNINGTAYTDVASAIAAINAGAGGVTVPLAANNTSGLTVPGASGADAMAVGYGAAASGDRGLSIGTNARVTATGGVAIGAGAVASRAGMNGGNESFSGTSVASTAGAMSVGAVGSERQITNVAGGTADTDAVNVRQLRAVGTNVATSFGAGAQFDPNTGAYTGPTFSVHGVDYSNVGSAISALQTSVVASNLPFASNNTSGWANPTSGGVDSIAVGNGAMSSGDRGASFGALAEATGTDSSAFGAEANATGANATAVGTFAAATGTQSSAFGENSSATGARSTAVGTSAAAAGDASLAVGAGASAAGNGAVALGQDANAAQTNSVAIGNGATTTRANQVAVGGAQSTYIFAGVASAQSLAAQSGPTRLVTTDSAGNLATSSFDPSAMAGQVASLSGSVDSLRRESRQGIAGAMALTSAPMPSLPGKTSWALNTATFKGEWGTGFSVAHRLNFATPIAITAGYTNSGGVTHAGRIGLAGEF